MKGIGMVYLDKDKGFSLVEMSVVLIIISFLITAVLTGYHLIRASELRSVISDVANIKKAVTSFQEKYSGLPGDITNAYALFASSSGCTDTDVALAAAGCNGDGDNRMDGSYLGAGENLRAWQHLSLSGLFPGNFTGLPNGVLPYIRSGVNAPSSKVSGGIYTFWEDSTASIFGRGLNIGALALHLGSIDSGDSSAMGGILNAKDAQDIDSKMDDGLASQGMLYTARSNVYSAQNKCVDAAIASASANYMPTDGTVACQLFFWLENK